MKNEPLVTVLMPCYNAMSFLKEALDSITNQTYKNLEILCINDGSTDETGIFLEAYAEMDKRINVIHNSENLRLIRTLNKGIELARGEYIARMDADDIATLDRIQVQIDYFNENPEIDVVCSASYNISENGKILSINIPRSRSALGSLYASFFFVPIGHPEVTFKSSVLKQNHFLFEEHALHTEDYELWSRLVRKGYHLTNIDPKLHYYRLNSQSVSRKFNDLQNQNFVLCVQKHYKTYFNIEYPKEVIQIIVNRIDPKTLNKINFKEALKIMKGLTAIFIEKEKITENTTLKEIKAIYSTHLFDVLFQSFKNASGTLKIYIFVQFIIKSHFLFNKSLFKYLKSKKV